MTDTIPRRAALTMAVATAATIVSGMAAAQAPPSAPAHTIIYLEIAPASMDAALALLRAHAATTRTEAGNIRVDLLRRIDRPHHFAIVERWSDAAAGDAHRASPQVAAFRAALAPMQIAPYDERPHTTLNIGEPGTAPGAITTVTHVDIIPPQREVGAANINQLGTDSRGTPGNLRFDVLIQNSRPNHFTLVETWRDEASLLAHAAAPKTRAYREVLLTMSGSLFDERLYRVVD